MKRALNIGGVESVESAYVVKGDDQKDGMQIDLLIERADDVVNLCEMKFCRSPFAVTKQYARTLAERVEAMEHSYPSLTFHLTYIGSSPLAQNEYSDLFVSTVTLDDLFA